MPTPSSSRELTLTRTLAAPRPAVYRCWTEPALLTQWFAPQPWSTPHAALDVRPGGIFHTVMRSPEGEDQPGTGVYLEVVPGERLVWTDAYSPGWEPAEAPFMTVIVTLEDAGPGQTHYTARVRHWREEDCRQHEAMGFHAGWGQCAEQLEQLARQL